MDRGYVAFLAAATVVCFWSVPFYLSAVRCDHQNGKILHRLRAKIAEVKADNVAAEKRLETTMNLDQIKEAAKNLD